MIKLVICGIGGRMGSRILALARENKAFQVIYGLESPIFKEQIEGLRTGSDVTQIEQADVVIDFTAPEATLKLAPFVGRYRKPYVIGTTGFTETQRQSIADIARTVPLVMAPNMSLGVNVFFKMVQKTAQALPTYEVEIIETHHKHKKDAPSGTALHAGGLVEKMTKRPVAYQSLREGEVVGDHRVIFKGPSERFELFHHAGSRDTFAEGALTAAQWVVKQPPGLYAMKDVLGL